MHRKRGCQICSRYSGRRKYPFYRRTKWLINSIILVITASHVVHGGHVWPCYGKAGVCSATLGPGAINLLLGTADAHTDSVPLVAISAVGLNREYKETHQFVDLVSMFKPVTKWAAEIKTPSAVPEMVRKAFKVAQTERPGSCYLGVPQDLKKCQCLQLFGHCFDPTCMIVLPLHRRCLGRPGVGTANLLSSLQVMALHERMLKMH